ncbi:MAG TPA: hypothetical protein VE135_23365 [Pyrinomonadaceae bacterium]|nr:hypothetical protein [Pyrinomonadaceae bacterium]
MKAMLCVISTMMALTLSPSIYAKGIPDLVTIKSEGMAHPIEITDRDTLRQFSPWMGQFIDWKKGVIPEPTNQAHSFEVSFYMKWNQRHSPEDRGDLKLIYSVKYCPGMEGQAGYVYLPGKGEDRYIINSGTILRDGDDGKWHQAAAGWETLMKQLIAGEKPPLTPHLAAMNVPGRIAGYIQVAFAAAAAFCLMVVLVGAQRRKRNSSTP